MARKYFKSEKQKEKELNEASQMLVDGIKNFANSDKYKQLLENFSKFHNYSLRNTILMTVQNPNVSYVASYDDWKKKFNRQVKKGEKGLKVFVPIKKNVWEKVPKRDENGEIVYDEDGNEVTEWKKAGTKLHFKIGYVFDISQSEQIEGKPVIDLELCKNLNGNLNAYNDILSALKELSPVPIQFGTLEENIRGFYSFEDKKIMINDNLSQVHTIKTLLHEMAHAKLHDEPDFKNPIKFCVVKDGQSPSRDMELDEAINEYNAIEGRGKSINFKIDDGSYLTGYFPLIQDGKLQSENINKVEHYRESEDVQRLITEMQKYFYDKNQLHSAREIQAESVAFIVCHHLGINTDDYSFPYITSWNEGTNTKDIEKELNVIKVTASKMIDKIDEKLDQVSLKPRFIFKVIESEIQGIKERDMSFAVANEVLKQYNNQYAPNVNTDGVYRTDFTIDVLQKNKEPLTYNGCYYAGIETYDMYHKIDNYIKDVIDENNISINEEFETVFLPALKEASECSEEDLQLAQEIFEENENEEEIEKDYGLEL